MHSVVQTAAVTILSYKPLSDPNFATYTQHYYPYQNTKATTICYCPDGAVLV